jgi:formylglycine-generating enzyme required for sulfatase activity
MDKSLYNIQQPQGISETLQNYIDSMVEEIVLEGKPFDTQKKYLKKFSENEGLDYDKLEADIVTFIEIIENLKESPNKLMEKFAEEKGRSCHISEIVISELLNNSKQQTLPEMVFEVKGIPFKMVRVEGGTFQMGATAEQKKDAKADEKPVHEVMLDSFYIGRTPVTQQQWEAVMGYNPSCFKGEKLPVEQVSWVDCHKFIN